jgi:GT2 family glycosyltransferase
MSSCDIIIPVWNQPEATAECVDSIKKCTRYPYRIIIVDNGSGPETAEYLKNLKESGDINVMLVRNESNEGFIKAVNKGIKLSDAKYLCLLNNDTIVTKGWLGEMAKVFTKGPLIGIVNPSSNTLGQKLPAGGTPEEFAENSRSQSGLFVELGSAFGFCMLMKRDLFDKIGLFDEVYGMGNFEDTDFSLRAKEKGYKTVRAFASYVYHKESRSFNLFRSFKKDFEKNKQIFESKWGKTRRVVAVCKNINSGSLKDLRGILDEYANQKSWAYVISPFFDTKGFFERHSNLTFYHYGQLFYIHAFLRILFKKKKPDIVYCDNKHFLDFLKAFRMFHNADVRLLGRAV